MSSEKSLPPLVNGKLSGHLTIKVDEIFWIKPQHGSIFVELLWWGDVKSYIFRPTVINKLVSNKDEDVSVIFNIRTSPDLFINYLTKCEKLIFKVFKFSNKELLGEAVVKDLSSVIRDKVPHSCYYPIFSKAGSRLGDLHISFELWLTRKDQVEQAIESAKSEKYYSLPSVSPRTTSSTVSSAKEKLVEDALDQGQKLRDAMAISVLEDSPLDNIETALQPNKEISTEKKPQASNMIDSSKLMEFLLGKDLPPEEELLALKTLRSISPTPSSNVISKSRGHRIDSPCKSRCCLHGSNGSSSCRSVSATYSGPLLPSSRNGKDVPKPKSILEVVNCYKLITHCLHLNSLGLRKVSGPLKKDKSASKKPSPGLSYILEIMPAITPDNNGKPWNVKQTRFASRKIKDHEITFGESTCIIENINGAFSWPKVTKQLEGTTIKIYWRYLNQRLPSLLGSSVIKSDSFSPSGLFTTFTLPVLTNNGVPAAHLSFILELGSNKKTFGAHLLFFNEVTAKREGKHFEEDNVCECTCCKASSGIKNRDVLWGRDIETKAREANMASSSTCYSSDNYRVPSRGGNKNVDPCITNKCQNEFPLLNCPGRSTSPDEQNRTSLIDVPSRTSSSDDPCRTSSSQSKVTSSKDNKNFASSADDNKPSSSSAVPNSEQPASLPKVSSSTSLTDNGPSYESEKRDWERSRNIQVEPRSPISVPAHYIPQRSNSAVSEPVYSRNFCCHFPHHESYVHKNYNHPLKPDIKLREQTCPCYNACHACSLDLPSNAGYPIKNTCCRFHPFSYNQNITEIEPLNSARSNCSVASCCSGPAPTSLLHPSLVIHELTISIDSILNFPILSQNSKEDMDCFVDYIFPVSKGNQLILPQRRSSTEVSVVGSDVSFSSVIKHTIALPPSISLTRALNTLPLPSIDFNVWGRFYNQSSPHPVDCILAKAILPASNLCSMELNFSEYGCRKTVKEKVKLPLVTVPSPLASRWCGSLTGCMLISMTYKNYKSDDLLHEEIGVNTSDQPRNPDPVDPPLGRFDDFNIRKYCHFTKDPRRAGEVFDNDYLVEERLYECLRNLSKDCKFTDIPLHLDEEPVKLCRPSSRTKITINTKNDKALSPILEISLDSQNEHQRENVPLSSESPLPVRHSSQNKPINRACRSPDWDSTLSSDIAYPNIIQLESSSEERVDMLLPTGLSNSQNNLKLRQQISCSENNSSLNRVDTVCRSGEGDMSADPNVNHNSVSRVKTSDGDDDTLNSVSSVITDKSQRSLIVSNQGFGSNGRQVRTLGVCTSFPSESKGTQTTLKKKHQSRPSTISVMTDSVKDLFKVKVEIERAIHLPSLKNDYSSTIEPSSYVCFEAYNDGIPQNITTNIVYCTSNPEWNAVFNVMLPIEYFYKCAKKLTVNVMAISVIDETSRGGDAREDKRVGADTQIRCAMDLLASDGFDEHLRSKGG